MTEFGYKLSSEEHAPLDPVRYSRRAEEAGFGFAMLSDHFHPWIDRQGHSPFAWGVLGAVAQATERLQLGTGVTCPTVRVHPAIVAQAAATTASLAPGRFVLGLGTGENLNEHILGGPWPPAAIRREMLAEAVEIIRGLWEGSVFDHRGRHYRVDQARLYTLPDEPPPILIAASGQAAATMAGQVGDGVIGLAPDRELLEAFDRAGGAGKPRYAEVSVCWAQDEQSARRTALEWWPNAGIEGELPAELPLPRHFEQAAGSVTEEALAKKVACGPDPERHLEMARMYVDAGYDHVWFHQIGPDQDGFFDVYEQDVLPQLS
jgi:coenzyme F420-dependent glucose-6-phosphate dehydrogenase